MATKKLCGIPGCEKGVGNNSYVVDRWNKEDVRICAKHRPFYEGFSQFDDGDLISVCDCGEFRFTAFEKCSDCDSNAIPVNKETLDTVFALCKAVYSKISDTTDAFQAVGNALVIEVALAGSYEQAIANLNARFKTGVTTPVSAVAATTQRKPSTKQLANEAKMAALKVASTKLIEGLQSQLPVLVAKLGLSEEMTAKVNLVLQSKLGTALLMGTVSLVASYAPLSPKYETAATMLASNFREQTMEILGEFGIESLMGLFSKDLVDNIQEQLKTVEQMVPVEQPVLA